MNRVLLVEDDYLSNLALQSYLQDAGFEVETAFCGLDALRAIRRQSPRSLVTDLDLGPGPDGFDVACQARAMRSDMQVVFVSSQPAPLGSLERMAGSQFIPKPFRAEQVVEALRRAATLAAA